MTDRLVLRNAKLVNEQSVDIVIENDKIVEVTESGGAAGVDSYDCSGLYVSSGWIDMHVHAFPAFDPYGDEIDEIGVKQGVTTIVDAGSCGADRITDLRASGVKAKTNLFAMLNISHIGLLQVDELSRLEWIDLEKAAQAVLDNQDIIVGLKARISKSVVKDTGIEPLRLARILAEKLLLPIMVHIGSGPPRIQDVLALLTEGDIITHYLNGKPNNLFDEEGQPLQELVDAVERGVHLDVGHGTASFSFKVAEAAKRAGIRPNTISTDIYRGNRLNGPVYSLSSVLTKFLYLGYSLKEVIDGVTIHAAQWLNKPDLGRIQPGDAANLTLFAVNQGAVTLTDSEGEQRIANTYIEAKGAIVNGTFIKC
ncbi:amidohydrolase/deacetylase family metallohydrolase [Paenibacillus macquariensis]|uniref:Dihydroorotase n=1 Tax=Paenibacillus macquariensis TaxID=948756 RepID=A0ABY1KBW4_9BACL|nr:amidohydrolase/deacetylase family metallohydrolase [Paenibacillus macquariensis]MEC0093511.1 amidohydrolase/deacetylase family metallohydrolase [Paenibacillus macquariensis]OAB29877.1 amidohydrolase [Paenibacillus macquariensis subsp. macquariensis]SIR57078.1 dihydroorotase [Paenibacillus macquariensis]